MFGAMILKRVPWKTLQPQPPISARFANLAVQNFSAHAPLLFLKSLVPFRFAVCSGDKGFSGCSFLRSNLPHGGSNGET